MRTEPQVKVVAALIPVCKHKKKVKVILLPILGRCPNTVRPVFLVVGLSTKPATQPYSDSLLNRTRSPSKPYLDKEIPLRRALRRLLCWLGSQVEIHRELALSQFGTVPKKLLNRQAIICGGIRRCS